jgi:pyruvate formate-lyase activating enzyme-like uncharacterized protein
MALVLVCQFTVIVDFVRKQLFRAIQGKNVRVINLKFINVMELEKSDKNLHKYYYNS